MKNKDKIIVILGPTASGKSDLAVKLAKKFNGEIISADSRQVYKGLNIGTGKITTREMSRIPHHLLDVASPRSTFNASDFKKLGEKAIEKIIKKGKLPIICGGTGMYISSLLGEITLPEVEPNLKLRKQLEEKSVEELSKILENLDHDRWENIDRNNPRRLIRAIEIAVALGPNSAKATLGKEESNKYDILKIGIKIPDEELKKRINKRLEDRIKKGMIAEAKRLHANGLSYKRMRSLGLEYGRLADFLEKKTRPNGSSGRINKTELSSLLQTEIWHYAKRQMTWFKRDKSIVWLLPKIKTIQKEVSKFLKS